MRRRFVFPAILFALSAVGASAQKLHVGAGTQSCGQWVEARHDRVKNSELRNAMMLSWVQGFLVGSARGAADEKLAMELAPKLVANDLDAYKTLALSDEKYIEMRQKKFGTVSGWTFDPPDSDAVQVWMDKYCSANPLDSVQLAAFKLEAELLGLDSSKTPAAAKQK